MFDSSSYDNPKPLAHADASRYVLPRGALLSHKNETAAFDSTLPKHKFVFNWTRDSQNANESFAGADLEKRRSGLRLFPRFC
ncbi:hypothetical protein TNCV_443421 [Trichonephila clavipes]|nr:hypothetical protein TNCV_443421 [Trichonephila clavipes]